MRKLATQVRSDLPVWALSIMLGGGLLALLVAIKGGTILATAQHLRCYGLALIVGTRGSLSFPDLYGWMALALAIPACAGTCV